MPFPRNSLLQITVTLLVLEWYSVIQISDKFLSLGNERITLKQLWFVCLKIISPPKNISSNLQKITCITLNLQYIDVQGDSMYSILSIGATCFFYITESTWKSLFFEKYVPHRYFQRGVKSGEWYFFKWTHHLRHYPQRMPIIYKPRTR